jgi:uncharacterized caspase-like protein
MNTLKKYIFSFLILLLSQANGYAKVYAMIIGVNDYTWQTDLKYATKDAMLFYSTLQQSNPNMDVEWNIILDADASIDNLVAHFVRYIENVKADDTFIFYFSGHGTEEGIYVSDGYNKSGHFPYDLLKTAIKYIPARDKLIFMDACNSASIIKKSITQYKNDQFSKVKRKQNENTSKQNTILFLGSGIREESIETGALGHGLFTFFLCYGLTGAADFNDDKLIQIDELFYFFRNNTFAASKIISPKYQCPLLIGNFDKKLVIADLNQKK